MRIVAGVIIAIVTILIVIRIAKIVIEDIKRDPVANLIIPAATAFLTTSLLTLLEMLRQ